MRLNQFIAHAGICARRKAEILIREQKITINGQVVCDFSYRVQPTDQVVYNGKLLKPQSMVYYVLNKPTNCITSLHDPRGRRTVLDLLPAVDEDTHIYPVGRLDRNTTGLLLLTNDGKLAKNLAHPASETPKIYEVVLKKPITEQELYQITQGLPLEDGIAVVDKIACMDRTKKVLEVVLHSGKNRIIRRMFSYLGHRIVSLARTHYAMLSLGPLPEGECRLLTKEEVNQLKSIQYTKAK